MPSGPKRELCSAKSEALWANGAPYELIKNTDVHVYSIMNELKHNIIYSLLSVAMLFQYLIFQNLNRHKSHVTK